MLWPLQKVNADVAPCGWHCTGTAQCPSSLLTNQACCWVYAMATTKVAATADAGAALAKPVLAAHQHGSRRLATERSAMRKALPGKHAVHGPLASHSALSMLRSAPSPSEPTSLISKRPQLQHVMRACQLVRSARSAFPVPGSPAGCITAFRTRRDTFCMNWAGTFCRQHVPCVSRLSTKFNWQPRRGAKSHPSHLFHGRG